MVADFGEAEGLGGLVDAGFVGVFEEGDRFLGGLLRGFVDGGDDGADA